MMHDMVMGGGMGWGMDLFGPLVRLVLILGRVARVKYLLFR